MNMQRWAENVLETTKTHFQNVLESLSILGGQKRVVLGNAQCLARQPSLALAELLKQKAGFQVQSQFWHHFVMVHIQCEDQHFILIKNTGGASSSWGSHGTSYTSTSSSSSPSSSDNHETENDILLQLILDLFVFFLHLFNGFPALTVTITITGRL